MADQPSETIWILRRATRAYRAAVRSALNDAGFGDVPQAGFWAIHALGAKALHGSEIAAAMDISRQAASQLVETLVSLALVVREHDHDDRRRMLLRLTPRGESANAAIERSCRQVDEAIAARIGADEFERLRELLLRATSQ